MCAHWQAYGLHHRPPCVPIHAVLVLVDIQTLVAFLITAVCLNLDYWQVSVWCPVESLLEPAGSPGWAELLAAYKPLPFGLQRAASGKICLCIKEGSQALAAGVRHGKGSFVVMATFGMRAQHLHESVSSLGLAKRDTK